MLDAFEILTTSGIVLWSRSNVDVSSTVVNSLINDVFIEEKVRPINPQGEETSGRGNPSYRHDKYTLKWTLVKDLGLIFVV
jgi:signal recognition particle receptor subunit alpha